MKSISDIISEANESKDKNWSQIRKGKNFYYLECYNSDKNYKIEVATVDENFYHETIYLSSGYRISEHYELGFTRKTKNKKGSACIWKKDWDKKILIDTLFSDDNTIFHYISTDRELLNEIQEKINDEDIKELEKEIKKFKTKYEAEKQKLEEQMNALIQKKLDKYED